MTTEVKVCFPDQSDIWVEKGTPLIELAPRFETDFGSPIVAAYANHKLVDLQAPIEEDSWIEFIELASGHGIRTYERSLVFLAIVAARRIFPEGRVVVEHSLGKAVYCELILPRMLETGDIDQLENEMRRLVEKNVPIIRNTVPVSEAIRLLAQGGHEDKVNLLGQMDREMVRLYSCEGVNDYLYGPMVPRTSYIRNFKLQHYSSGFLLRFPLKENPDVIPDFIDLPKLAGIFHEAEQWGDILGCSGLAKLNEEIVVGGFNDIVRIAEALHEKKVAQIADNVADHREKVRVILIAGPSSSGKTTFAQRLSVQLRVNGIRPLAISLDDYFLNRLETPRDTDGNYDFEALEAIDLPLFNEHLSQLLAGRSVEPPLYNFKTGLREHSGRRIRLDSNQVLLIEGIHGLNEKLTQAVPHDRKKKIYVSALTQLSIDEHNRIPTTDTRLLRRIVRDSQFRGHDALETLQRWPAVRRGEERNIFPFQEQADMMFNSALIYELSILRRYADPLLAGVPQEMPEYLEARRLLSFISHFRLAPEEQIPPNSILREFIGQSCFS